LSDTESSRKDEIRRKVDSLLYELEEKGTLVREHGKLSSPIPVYAPNSSKLVSWFVGITVGNKIASFLQFDETGDLIRYSSFQRDRTSVEGCPDAEMWLDSSYAIRQAKTRLGKNAVVRRSYLSYHQNITQLAWIVKASEKSGTEKTVYVAGSAVFEE
jgi:hypothetical protein